MWGIRSVVKDPNPTRVSINDPRRRVGRRSRILPVDNSHVRTAPGEVVSGAGTDDSSTHNDNFGHLRSGILSLHVPMTVCTRQHGRVGGSLRRDGRVVDPLRFRATRSVSSIQCLIHGF